MKYDSVTRKVLSRRATVMKINALFNKEVEHEPITIYPETPLEDPLAQCVKDYTYISSFLRLMSNYHTDTGQGVTLPLTIDEKQLIFMRDGSFAQVKLENGKLPDNGNLEKLAMTDVLRYGSADYISEVIDTELSRLANIAQDDDIQRNPDKYYRQGMVPVVKKNQP